MPPGFEPFLAAILADPDDDVRRLVAADWLDEHADPARAEFIRVQVELAGSPADHGLRARERELYVAHGGRWVADVPWDRAGAVWDVGRPAGPFARGFPAVAGILTVPKFTAHAGELFAAAPVEFLIFPEPRVRDLAAALGTRAVAPVRGFNAVWNHGSPPGNELCQALAGCRHLRRLRYLDLAAKGVTDAGARALSGAAFLGQLAELQLHGNPIGERPLVAVAGRLRPDRVERLVLPAALLGAAARAELTARFGPAVEFR